MYLMRNCVAMRVWFILALINKNATIVKVSKYDTHIYNAYLSNIKKSIIFSPLLMSLPKGSFKRKDLKSTFDVTDNKNKFTVEYTGILPDLFREGQGIVTTGSLVGNLFVATEVLAKHDENYMPPEVADALEEAKK
jgi:hypothetical protein